MADQKRDFNSLFNSVATARKELARLRKDVKVIKNMFVKRFQEVESMLKQCSAIKVTDSSELNRSKQEQSKLSPLERNVISTNNVYNNRVIGYIKTCFKEKNGIPRQGSVCPLSKAELCINGVQEFTNPSHALDGLESFSHVWLLFIFHKNSNNSLKAKVRPPRLDGRKIGVFASRSPHRPSPIGLTLARLDNIQGNKLFLSAIDILDGTPILDIKPYIPDYDSVYTGDKDCFEKVLIKSEEPRLATKPEISKLDLCGQLNQESPLNQVCSEQEIKASDEVSSTLISDWIGKPPIAPLSVSYTDKAAENLKKFHKDDFGGDESYQLELLASAQDVKHAIETILREDPRSIYRRNHCANELYHFIIDNVNVSCVFMKDAVEVVNINPIQSNKD